MSSSAPSVSPPCRLRDPIRVPQLVAEVGSYHWGDPPGTRRLPQCDVVSNLVNRQLDVGVFPFGFVPTGVFQMLLAGNTGQPPMTCWAYAFPASASPNITPSTVDRSITEGFGISEK